MKRNKFLCLIVSVFLLLVSCGEEGLRIDNSTPIPTATQLPTKTATTIPTITPAAPLFPVFTPDWSSILVTPTSIATPSSIANNFQLSDWNAGKAVDLVHSIEKFVYARDEAGLSGNRFAFQSDQKYTKLAVLEALARYPESDISQDLRWKLANIHAVLNESTFDNWIISTLEEGLNNGAYSLADLDVVLSQHGFEIDERHTIPNLFGDGKAVEVILINTTHIYTADGLLVAIREISPGVYELILMVSDWDFHYGMMESVTFEDFNDNGLPEVFAGFAFIASGSDFCSLYILEWQEDHFAVLTEDGESIGVGGNCGYTFDKANQVLKIEKGERLDYSESYRWHGEYSELIATEYNSISENIYHKFLDQEFEQAIEEIESYLAGDSSKTIFRRWVQVDEGAAKDFLQFVLGLAYAVQGEVKQAREIFLDLAQSPANPDYPYISQAAQDFVTNYGEGVDVPQVCLKALEVLHAVPGYIDEQGYRNSEVIGLSGYSREEGLLDSYCPEHTRTSSEILSEAVNSNLASSLPAVLRNAKINGFLFKPFDLWNDGNQDWLFVAAIDSDFEYGTFLAIWFQKQWTILELESWSARKPASIHVDQVTLPGLDSPVVIARVGEDIHLFDVEIKEDLLSHRSLLYESPGGSSEVHLINFDFLPEVHVFNYGEYWYGSAADKRIENAYEWTSFYWDESQRSFFNGVAAEHLILDLNQYRDAIDGLKIALEIIEPYYQRVKADSKGDHDYFSDTVSPARAHLLYLLGLAYELTGDEVHAAQTYYQVWHDHPDTAYAIMARMKLEPID